MMYPNAKYPPSSRFFRRGYLLDGLGEVVDGAEVSPVPRIGMFFRPPKTEDWTIWKAANVARKAAGLASNFTYKTIKAIAASPFNKSHVAYTNKGYENYPFTGPQFLRLYGDTLKAEKGTGQNYPVIWIPNPTTPLEPAVVTTTPPAVTPVTTPITTTTPPVVTPVTQTTPATVAVTTPPAVTPVTTTPIVAPVAPTATGPSMDEILLMVNNAISKWFKNNPYPEAGISKEQALALIAAAIKNFPITQAIANYFDKHPLPEGGLTREQVAIMIKQAIAKIPPPITTTGKTGPMGPQGPPGVVKASAIEQAISKYFSENPMPPGGVPREQIQEMIRNAVGNISREQVTIEKGKSDGWTSFVATLPIFTFLAKL